MPKSIESDNQIALFKWLKLNESKHPAIKWIFHPPNGQKRDIRVAKRLKDEGVKAGIHDICIPYASQGKNGMFIEMKAPKGRLTDRQKEFKQYLEKNNYKSVVCYSWIEARDEIIEYLEL